MNSIGKCALLGSRKALDPLRNSRQPRACVPSDSRLIKALCTLPLAFTTAEVCIHDLPVALTRRLIVFGQPEMATYEWAVLFNENIVEHSNQGYGCSDIALRDGLIACYGAPANTMSCDCTLASTARQTSQKLRFDNRPGSTARQSSLGLFLAGWQSTLSSEFPETAAVLETLVFGPESRHPYGPASIPRTTGRNG
ncbi:hypothetical protein JOE11_001604 [Robbsia andropogonis]|uniref:hypothetical protein n=1 Tax=Robbsia andropogonis TaxID=28092 RepID=UPI003D1E16EC